jgi:thymidylate synthase (FAD)
MRNIEVSVLQSPSNVAALASLACNLTQHPITSADELDDLFTKFILKPSKNAIKFCQEADHQSVTRHGTYTLAIVGASRRFLAQIRTHHVGIDFTSASLQYQDVSGTAQFVVPYEVLQHCKDYDSGFPLENYLQMCAASADSYIEMLNDDYDNDTAGYVSCQALRNVLLVTGNAESFRNLIKKRACNRNTVETQYTALLIWAALLGTKNGELMFGNIELPCMNGLCDQGKMCCGKYMDRITSYNGILDFIFTKWPLLEMEV